MRHAYPYYAPQVLESMGFVLDVDYIAYTDGIDWFADTPIPSEQEITEAWPEMHRADLIKLVSRLAAEKIDAVTKPWYSSSEEATWIRKEEDARACKASGYTEYPLNGPFARELDATPGMTAQQLADRVISAADDYWALLTHYQAARTVLQSQLLQLTEHQLFSVTADHIINDPLWGGEV